MKQYTNKEIVLDFYKKVIGEQNLEYAAKSVTDNYIQHNPHVKTGKEGFLEAIQFLRQMPKPKKPSKPFIRVVSDDDYVVLHLNIVFGGERKVLIEVFRLENGLLAEHWDAIQHQSKTSLNGNSEIEGPNIIADEENTIKNKVLVEQFVKQVLIKRDFVNLKNFVAPHLIQHNPKVKNGLNGLLEYYRSTQIQKVHKILGEGNFVVTQSRAILDNQDHVCYDIYRIKNDMIQEHWSVSQKIPEKMAHQNGMI